MAETNDNQSFKGGTPIFDRSNENYNAWIADKTNLSFTDWLNEKNAGRTKNVDMNTVNPSVANNEFGLLSPDTVFPFRDYQNLYQLYGSSALSAAAPEAASAPAAALVPERLLSGQGGLNELPLTLNPRNDAPAPSAPAAPTSVLGMFPEVEAMQRALYQQKQNEAMQAQAMQFARLSPMERAQYSLYMGGQQLGGAIGSALGGKDPQLQMIGLQQQILRELDPSDPAQQLRVARKYAQAAPELAMKIADNALSSQVKIAQINRERKAAIGVPLQVSDRINELNQKMRMLPPDSVEYKDAEEEKTRLMKPEKPEPRPSVGSDTERISLDKFGKNYYDLDQPQRAVVSKLVEEDAIKKAPKFQVDLKDPTATAKASLDVMSKWEGFLKSGGDVEVANRFKQVRSAASMANANNPSADSALLYSIAKMYDPSGAVQEGDKKTIMGNPSIPNKFKLLVQGVLEGGTFLPEQRKNLVDIATEIVKNRQSQLSVYRKQYVKKNKTLGGDETDILDPYQGLIPLDAFVR